MWRQNPRAYRHTYVATTSCSDLLRTDPVSVLFSLALSLFPSPFCSSMFRLSLSSSVESSLSVSASFPPGCSWCLGPGTRLLGSQMTGIYPGSLWKCSHSHISAFSSSFEHQPSVENYITRPWYRTIDDWASETICPQIGVAYICDCISENDS
jgi:hypothetical protein